MARIEDQRIIIWCNQEKGIDLVIQYAIYLAKVLEKEVCFFGSYTNDRDRKKTEKKIDAIASAIAPLVNDISFSRLVLKGRLKNLVETLGQKYGAVLLCIHGPMKRRHMQAFYNSGFPFLYVKNGLALQKQLQEIIVPIDFRQGTKESIVWSSYLGRFNRSKITLLKANDHDAENSEDMNIVAKYAERLFSQFNFKYQFVQGKKSSWKIHREAIDKFDNTDLIIFTGSLNVTPIDYLYGPFERLLVNKAQNTAVLLVNPQREMFVMCS